ncbi:hypothetical protein ACRALDRAFT_209887 [Sodiomyces alcalophilus JCM 7366]|uniref:uncharacterized protein n=1 Tax=Sodiomyces alcalophilus JCM 7366 TaxID=591952 RepID=UPI0039B58427
MALACLQFTYSVPSQCSIHCLHYAVPSTCGSAMPDLSSWGTVRSCLFYPHLEFLCLQPTAMTNYRPQRLTDYTSRSSSISVFIFVPRPQGPSTATFIKTGKYFWAVLPTLQWAPEISCTFKVFRCTQA